MNSGATATNIARLRRRLRREKRRWSTLPARLKALLLLPDEVAAARQTLALLLLAETRRSPVEAATTATRSGARLCSALDLLSAEYVAFCAALRLPVLHHRKQWEFFFIAQAVEQAGLLKPGVRAVGFGVGVEPLVAWFASKGVDVVATDLAPDDARSRVWRNSGQHAARAIARLNPQGVCPDDVFARSVRWRDVDMTAIPADLRDFDFAWSACALEHLGSIDRGLEFVTGSLRCVRPGGLVVHTTEFNVDSDDATLDDDWTVLFRRRDLARLAGLVAQGGGSLDAIDLELGRLPLDLYIDVPPYLEEPHLRLRFGPFTTTSVGLIARRH